jgi:hypothetical protein
MDIFIVAFFFLLLFHPNSEKNKAEKNKDLLYLSVMKPVRQSQRIEG